MARMGDGTGRRGHVMAPTGTTAPALLGGGLTLLLAGAAGPAAASMAPITSCGALITLSGTYVLAKDLNLPLLRRRDPNFGEQRAPRLERPHHHRLALPGNRRRHPGALS